MATRSTGPEVSKLQRKRPVTRINERHHSASAGLGSVEMLPRQITTRRLHPATILHLQQRYGNAHVQRLLHRPRGEQPQGGRFNGETTAGGANRPQAKGGASRAAGSRKEVAGGFAAGDLLAGPAAFKNQIRRAADKGTDGSQYIELEIPDGAYVLEAANVPGVIRYSLKYSRYLDIFATASQYAPRHINGLNAVPHKLLDTRSGPDLTEFRVKPGEDLESRAGKGSARVQAFRHNIVWDDPVLQAYLTFSTVPLIDSAGDTEFVAANMWDMNPAHHDPVTIGTEGTAAGKEETSTIELSDGMTYSTSKTVDSKVSAELTQKLGLDIGIIKVGSEAKTAVSRSASKTVGKAVTSQISKKRTVKTSYRFDKPGHYAIVPTFKLWRTPVVINAFDPDTGRQTGKENGFLYAIIYNPTGSTAKVAAGKVRKPVLDMHPDEFAKDEEAQKELFAMARKVRDKQQKFAESLMAEQKITGKVKSVLKRDGFEDFVKGVVAKCKRNGYIRIGQMDDIVRGRFDLRSGADVDAIALAMKEQKQYLIKEIIAPRRPQNGGGFGYPRWHIIVVDNETELTHEWQIGTEAVSTVYEKKGVPIPKELEPLPEGMNNDLHDIEYDIFKGIKKKYPDIHERYGLPAFHAKVDQLSAEAGLKGEKTPELHEKIAKLHREAGALLQRLVDDFGPEWIKQFYH